MGMDRHGGTFVCGVNEFLSSCWIRVMGGLIRSENRWSGCESNILDERVMLNSSRGL